MFRRILLIAVFVSSVFSQETETKDQKEKAAVSQKEAVVFLRETMADVSNLRTLENRISFSAEMAGLMWFHDESEARGMFLNVIGDFRQLLINYDSQMNSLDQAATEPDSSGIFGETPDRAQLARKFRTAISVRQQIASSIAEHDPDLALSFYFDSGSTITNKEFRTQFLSQDIYFEATLIGQIAENNAAKAAQLASDSLKRGLTYQHVDLLRKIYAKDAENGIEFGSALLGKIKSEKPMTRDLYIFGSLLDFGSETLVASQKEGGKRAIYSVADLREIADIMASAILNGDAGAGEAGMQYLSQIEKYQPGRAMQIRAKYPSKKESNTAKLTVSGGDTSASLTPDDVDSASMPPPGNLSSDLSKVGVQGSTEEKLVGDVAKIGKGALPKEEREKVIAQARKILMQTRGKDKQIMGLSSLAAQVSRVDKDLAAEIMRDAESLVNPNPKNYHDFMFTWLLASGYAEAEPDKAFPILEDAISRANSLISAFIRVGEFIDIGGEMINDGEVQVGAFGGGMIRGLSQELGIAEGTINNLIHADFAKTRALTNRFERPEVRILAKMLVLRSALGRRTAKPSADQQVEVVLDQH